MSAGGEPPATHHLDGARVDSIDDLYAQFTALFQGGEGWPLATSLDALDDALYRAGRSRVVWTDHAHSRRALGEEATRRWLEGKLATPERFDVARIERQLDALRAGTGPTYFDLVLQVFAGHADRIELVLS